MDFCKHQAITKFRPDQKFVEGPEQTTRQRLRYTHNTYPGQITKTWDNLARRTICDTCSRNTECAFRIRRAI